MDWGVTVRVLYRSSDELAVTKKIKDYSGLIQIAVMALHSTQCLEYHNSTDLYSCPSRYEQRERAMIISILRGPIIALSTSP